MEGIPVWCYGCHKNAIPVIDGNNVKLKVVQVGESVTLGPESSLPTECLNPGISLLCIARSFWAAWRNNHTDS